MPLGCRSWRSKPPLPAAFSFLVSSLIIRRSRLVRPISLHMRFMCRLQNFVGVGVIGRQKRQRAQVAENIPTPDSSEGNGHNYVRQSQMDGRGKMRLDDPEQVEVANQQQPNRQP